MIIDGIYAETKKARGTIASLGLLSKPGRWPSSQPNTKKLGDLIYKSDEITQYEKYHVQFEILLWAYELLHHIGSFMDRADHNENKC